ncbi:MAG: superoxide dismutase, partial [Gemmatimonadaceae bacterium]
MPFTLPSLPFPANALEPHIDARTMEIHHGKHHQAYVTNLNTALEKAPEHANKPIEQVLSGLNSVPEAVRTAVRNNGGGHWNHTLFWEIMGPNAGGTPGGKLAQAITSSFGDFEKFKEQFAAAGGGRFGSGWVWLLNEGGKLSITSTPNQDNPIMDGRSPQSILLGLDVWEHAYYLNYQNRR